MPFQRGRGPEISRLYFLIHIKLLILTVTLITCLYISYLYILIKVGINLSSIFPGFKYRNYSVICGYLERIVY